MGIGTARVLCADDQQETIDLLSRHLGSTYDRAFAKSSAEALRALESNGPFAVVIADCSMPDTDGIADITTPAALAPPAQVIDVTLYFQE